MTRLPREVLRSLGIVSVLLVLLIGTALAQTGGEATKTAPAGSGSAAPTVAAPSSAGPVSSGKASTTAGAEASGMDGATYSVRLRDLEQRIDELKEQIRRSHTRLSLLSETILGGGVAGSRAQIMFENTMSGAFRLTRAVFVLDGAVQYNKSDDTGALSEKKSLPIYTGSIPPGDHTLQVLLEFRGHGYGVFSYLRGYRFEVRSSHSFTVVEGKAVHLRAIAYEKGGVTTPLEERPAIRYVEKAVAIEASSSTSSSGSKAPGSASGSFSIGGK